MFFFDLDNNPVDSFSLLAEPSTDTIFHQEVECHNGYKLKSDVASLEDGSAADVQVYAKHNSSGVYLQLEGVNTIDLSTWDGTIQVFDFKITTGATDDQHAQIVLRVEP